MPYSTPAAGGFSRGVKRQGSDSLFDDSELPPAARRARPLRTIGSNGFALVVAPGSAGALPNEASIYRQELVDEEELGSINSGRARRFQVDGPTGSGSGRGFDGRRLG